MLENVMLGFDGAARATLLEASVHAPRSRADERRFRAASRRLLERVRADAFADRPAGAVPYAIQRQVELARVLAGQPAFVLLDEAAAGLNDDKRHAMGEVIKSISADNGPGVLVIEHNMDLVRQVCDRIVVLVNGSVLLSGPTAEALGRSTGRRGLSRRARRGDAICGGGGTWLSRCSRCADSARDTGAVAMCCATWI